MTDRERKEVYEYFERLGYSREMMKEEVMIAGEKVDLVIYFRGKPCILYLHELAGVEGDIVKKSIQQGAKYFVVGINGVKYWNITNEKEFTFIRSHKSPLSEIIPSITQMHEEIFNFLYQKKIKNKNFKFRLRVRNTRSRLDRGYWFGGNDDYLVISFWAGNDAHNKSPYLYFHIGRTGDMYLYFIAKTSDKLAKFFKDLAPVLGLKKGREGDGRVVVWSKKYYSNWQGDYLKVIEKFIQTEKVTIDQAILIENKLKNNDLDGLQDINDEAFEKNLKKILSYRKSENLTSNEKHSYLNYPILPATLSLVKIGHFSEINLDINNRVVCFLGENGSGKTTILRSLLLALTGTEESSKINVTDRRFQQMLKIFDIQENGNIQYELEGYIRLKYFHREPCLSMIVFSVTGNIVSIHDQEIENFSSFTSIYDKDYYTQLIIGFAQVLGKKGKSKKKVGLNQITKANIRDVLPLLKNEEDNRFEDLSEWIISLYTESLKKEGAKEGKILDSIFKIISEITDSPIKLLEINALVEPKAIWVQIEDQNPILFSLLSQGYKNVFAWVGYFMKRLAEANDYAVDFMNRPAILAIDEIDTYLHPKWQRNILNVLAKRFPNTRFYITTHSPLVANYFDGEDIAVYIIEEDNVRKIKHTYGGELSRIFYNWMGINQRPEKIQNHIDKLFILLDQEKVEEATELYKTLSTVLGEDDGDLVEAKTELDLLAY